MYPRKHTQHTKHAFHSAHKICNFRLEKPQNVRALANTDPTGPKCGNRRFENRSNLPDRSVFAAKARKNK